MSKKKEPIIDYMTLSKTMIVFGTLFLLMILSIASLSMDQPEYDSYDGIVVDKYAVHDKKWLSGEMYSYYYLIVDCNGTNRTHMYLSEDLLRWQYTEIGDTQHVCWKVEN